MSTYDDRLAALEACTGGETVTVPAGWTVPAERALDARAPRPGDVYTHDGGDDSIPWTQTRPGLGTGIIRYVPGSLVAAFGLTVDIDEDTKPAPLNASRLDRLKAATVGDTVTIPRGHSGIIAEATGFLPGDVLMNDGSSLSLAWEVTEPAARRVIYHWLRSVDLAEAGLDVDATPAADTAEAPAPDASTVIVEDLAAADTPAPSPLEEMSALRRSVDEANARAAAAEREAVVESVHADMRHRAQALEHAHRIAGGTLDVAEVVALAEWILGGDR